jgi:predicted aspartyl protease
MPVPGDCFTVKTQGLAVALVSDAEIESAMSPAGRIKVRAAWDTGAEQSLISVESAKRLNLQSLSVSDIIMPTGETASCNVYLVNVYLANGRKVSPLAVLEGMPGEYDMLIGMDIITLGDFAVTNGNGATVFSFRMPSMDTIDFCEHPHLK